MAGTITGLQAQKRNPKRVNVYLDGTYAFPLDLAVAMQEGLRRGQELSDADIARLTAADDAEKAYNRALALLSYRPRSTAEVRRNLEGKKTPPHVVDQVIRRLTASGLLDDAAFARVWVENRAAFSPRSARLLGYELRQKGVAANDIDTALSVDDQASALEAARRRARAYARLDHDGFRRKLLPFLQRRGFGYEDATNAVETVWREIHTESFGT